MGIPWETIVKQYRSVHGNTTFPILSDYMDDFCNFLIREGNRLISPETQRAYALVLAGRVLAEIEKNVQSQAQLALHQAVDNDESITIEQLQGLVIEFRDGFTSPVVNQYHELAQAAPNMEEVSPELEASITGILGESFEEVCDEIFQRTIPPETSQKLYDIATKAISGFHSAVEASPFFTGVAVAGFGENDMLPAITEVHIEGIVQGTLKKQSIRSESLSVDNGVLIVPLAQGDMIFQFMEGIAPEYEEYISRSMSAYFDTYLDNLMDVFGSVSSIDIAPLRDDIKKSHPQIVESFNEGFTNFRIESTARQIVDAVRMLPKEHLAEMAEALVNLTSLKRRVSLQEETVGGPTDVAVITKGDGMVWIKRKQYFAPELNPGYFARAYGRIASHGTNRT